MATRVKETIIELRNSEAEVFLKKILSDKKAAFDKNSTPEAIASIREKLSAKKK